MRKHKASSISRITEKFYTKVDEPNEEPEELIVEPSEVCVSQSSSDWDNDESEEPEEEPEEKQEGDSIEELEREPDEKLEEEPEEETSEELEEDPDEELGEEPDEELEEEPEEETSEELEEEPDEELEEDSSEETNEEPAEEPREWTSLSVSNLNNYEAEQTIEDSNPLEDSASKPSSETDANKDGYKSESVLNNSNEKKRSLDATAVESDPLQINQSRKKCRQEESSKQGSDFGFAVRNLHIKIGVSKTVDSESASGQQECMGSSEKRRRSRWDTRPLVDCEMNEVDRISKRRKTRWAGDDSQLKMLGPIQLPDFVKEFVIESDLDPQIRELQSKLLGVNSKLKSSKLHDDRPEEERSPSPQPVYNNLGIRINTREVRLREKFIQERQDIILRLIQKNPTFKPPTDYKAAKLLKKLYIPVKEYPEYNFIGLILGPRGNTKKRMEKQTGAKIFLRGRGSSKQKPDTSDNEDLHVLIEAGNQKSLDAAVATVEKLLIPIQGGMNEHKLAQLQELAELNGSYRDENKCSVCSEQGHKHYACPRLQSTFKIALSCDSCGGNSHPAATCPFTASSHASNSLQGLGSTPKTQNKHKETNDANLYVGYLPQAVDDNRLRELFKPFGKLTEVRVIKDRTTGLSKGYGFVKFEITSDAALAVTHMNGYKTDGKMLAVRVAGRQPVSSFSILSHLPIYPGPAAVSPVVPSQTAWPGPPGSMLSEPQDLLPKSDGACFPSSSIYTGHRGLLHKSDALGFSPSPGVSSLPDSMSASSLNSSYKCSNQSQFMSPISLAQFPGDPDYRGSQFLSYFATPTVKPSPPYHFSQLPESDLKPFSWSITHFT